MILDSVQVKSQFLQYTSISMEHNLNLENVSPQLEAKRRQHWAKLTPEEQESVIELYSFAPPELSRMVPFKHLKDTRQRVLYVLAMPRTPLSIGEINYLFIARWLRNVDRYTLRARLANLTAKGLVREYPPQKFSLAQLGWDELYKIKREWLLKEAVSKRASEALDNYKRSPEETVK